MNLSKNIATSESGFIFNPSTGDSYSANAVAVEILNLLRQGRSLEEIRIYLLDNYNVDPFRLDRDWDDFINQLREAHLIES